MYMIGHFVVVVCFVLLYICRGNSRKGNKSYRCFTDDSMSNSISASSCYAGEEMRETGQTNNNKYQALSVYKQPTKEMSHY